MWGRKMEGPLLICIKVGIFLLSNVGWWTWIYKRTEIDTHFLPPITIMIQSTLLFFAGLLNILYVTAFLLYGIGLVLFTVFLIKEGFGVVRYLRKIELIVFLLCILVIFYITRDITIYMDDDFHHWALLVKELLRNNCYPTDNYPIVYYRSYLPGTATYIYYFCRFSDQHESVYVWAQNYMMLCFFVPFGLVNKNKNPFVYLYLISTYSFVVYYNASTYNLMVDTILPLAFLAILCYALYMIDGKIRVENIVVFSFMTTGLLLIKNSALYFYAILALVVLYGIWTKRSNISEKMKEVGIIIVPLLSLYLWRRHCLYVFKNPDSLHTLSKTYLASTYEQKTPEIVLQIKEKFLEFAFSGKELLYVLIGFMVLIICTWIFSGKWKNTIRVLFFSMFLYVTYMIGLHEMYLYSMPVTDALRLASSERYRTSILICIFTFISVCISEYAVRYIDNCSVGAKRIITYVLLTILSVLSFYNQNVFMGHPSPLKTREWLKEQIEAYKVQAEKSYYIVADTNNPDINGWLLTSVVRYDLLPERIDAAYDPKDTSDLEEADKYDYVILMDKDNISVNKWVEDHYPEQNGNDVIVCRDK